MKLFYSAMDLADTAVCGSHLQPVFDFTNSLDLLGVLGVFIFSNHFESVPFEQYSWGRGQPTSTALACSNPRFSQQKKLSKKQHDQHVQRLQAGQRCQREIGAELSFKSLQVLAFGYEVTSSIQTHLRFCSECQDYTLALYCNSECTHFTRFLDLVLCMHRSCHWTQVRQILKMQRRCSPRVQVTAARPMRQKEWIPEGRPCQSEI